MHNPAIAHVWVNEFLLELRDLGVKAVAIAPGSRSTVLASRAAEIFGRDVTIHFDERGLGFFALGAAKASGAPACVITTSGTAVANLLPAVIEAHYAEIPLIVISADRPPELLNCGTNQTIHQPDIFGVYPQWSCEIPCASGEISIDTIRDWARKAVRKSIAPGHGPVHINWMFREPFFSSPHTDEVIPVLPRPAAPPIQPAILPRVEANMAALHQIVRDSKRGLCLIGELSSEQETAATVDIIRALGWTTFADSLSQLRQRADLPYLVNYADLALLAPIPAELEPDTVIHLGGRVTSKRLTTLLAPARGRTILSISNRQRPFNPLGGIDKSIHASLSYVAQETLERPTFQDSQLLDCMRRRDQAIEATLPQHLATSAIDPITEPALLALLSSAVPSSHLLFLGNSMPIRDFEMFAQRRSTPPQTLANRGASGIDGVLSTALGAASRISQSGTLIVGDLSFLHDLNALALAKLRTSPFVVVVINNDGGGIFSLLPVSGTSSFERCFGTPHGVTFEGIVGSFGLPYVNPANINELLDAYAVAITRSCATVIEVRTSREENAALHHTIHKAIASVLK